MKRKPSNTFKGMKFLLLQKPGRNRQAASSDSFLVGKSWDQPEPSERENLDHDTPAWPTFRLPPHFVDQDAVWPCLARPPGSSPRMHSFAESSYATLAYS